MLYLAYQTHADLMAPLRMFAGASLSALEPWAATEDLKVLRNLTAAYELVARAGLTHTRPPYGISSVRMGNREHQGSGAGRIDGIPSGIQHV